MALQMITDSNPDSNSNLNSNARMTYIDLEQKNKKQYMPSQLICGDLRWLGRSLLNSCRLTPPADFAVQNTPSSVAYRTFF